MPEPIVHCLAEVGSCRAYCSHDLTKNMRATREVLKTTCPECLRMLIEDLQTKLTLLGERKTRKIFQSRPYQPKDDMGPDYGIQGSRRSPKKA